MFPTLLESFPPFSSNSKFSSANSFTLEESQITTQSCVLSTLKNKAFEKIVGKGEYDGDQHFILFLPQCFLACNIQILYWATLKHNEVNSKVKCDKYTCNKKRIQKPIRKPVLYMTKRQFGQCWRGSKLDTVMCLVTTPEIILTSLEKKNIIFIFHLRIYFVAFLMSLSTCILLQSVWFAITFFYMNQPDCLFRVLRRINSILVI